MVGSDWSQVRGEVYFCACYSIEAVGREMLDPSQSGVRKKIGVRKLEDS